MSDMIRPEWKRPTALIACSCGQTLHHVAETRQHWQDGHFDYPVSTLESALAEAKTEISTLTTVIEERGHAFQDAVNKALEERDMWKTCSKEISQQRDRYREALEKILKECDCDSMNGSICEHEKIIKEALREEG